LARRYRQALKAYVWVVNQGKKQKSVLAVSLNIDRHMALGAQDMEGLSTNLKKVVTQAMLKSCCYIGISIPILHA